MVFYYDNNNLGFSVISTVETYIAWASFKQNFISLDGRWSSLRIRLRSLLCDRTHPCISLLHPGDHSDVVPIVPSGGGSEPTAIWLQRPDISSLCCATCEKKMQQLAGTCVGCCRHILSQVGGLWKNFLPPNCTEALNSSGAHSHSAWTVLPDPRRPNLHKQAVPSLVA